MTPPTPALATEPAVALCDVTRRFADGRAAVEEFSLDIPAGQFLALLGPSGCGKSTLLRLIAGLDRPTAGDVSVHASGVGYVFQDAHLMPWRSVLDNVALPLELAGVGKPERRQRAVEALGRVGLNDTARLYPAQLSGGMRMRVSLARALIARPALLLLDEPFAALDEITRQHLDDLLRGLWQRDRMTVLFVTHSIGEAAYLAERVIVLSRRPARVMLDVRPDLPKDRQAGVRTTAAFAEQTHALFDALQRGESA